MVLEDPGRPVGDIGSRRTTRVENAPQLRTSKWVQDFVTGGSKFTGREFEYCGPAWSAGATRSGTKICLDVVVIGGCWPLPTPADRFKRR
jgi:hypothetical protein